MIYLKVFTFYKGVEILHSNIFIGSFFVEKHNLVYLT